MRAVSPFCGGAAAVSGGGESGAAQQQHRGRRAARAEGEGRRGAGQGAGWRGGAHVVCGIHVHSPQHEAGERDEVALRTRLDKIHLRLQAQPSTLSASQEQWG